MESVSERLVKFILESGMLVYVNNISDIVIVFCPDYKASRELSDLLLESDFYGRFSWVRVNNTVIALDTTLS